MNSCVYCGRDPRPSVAARKRTISGWYVVLFGALVTAAVAGSIRERAADASSIQVDTPNDSISRPTGSLSRSIQGEEGCTILVRGTEGLPFQGSFATVQTAGDSKTKSVEGTVPAIYQVKGTTVSTFFAKKEDPGSLRVEILTNGSVIKSSETNAARGSVTVTAQ